MSGTDEPSLVERACQECGGCGWVVGTDTRCCGRSDYECGGRGCTGPEPEQVQEACEFCGGTGNVAIAATSLEADRDALIEALTQAESDFAAIESLNTHGASDQTYIGWLRANAKAGRERIRTTLQGLSK